MTCSHEELSGEMPSSFSQLADCTKQVGGVPFEEKVAHVATSMRWIQTGCRETSNVRVIEAARGNHLAIHEWMAPKSVSCLCALNRYAVRFIVVKCPIGCESIARHPAPLWHGI